MHAEVIQIRFMVFSLTVFGIRLFSSLFCIYLDWGWGGAFDTTYKRLVTSFTLV